MCRSNPRRRSTRCPYLPDLLSRGAAIRDLPGSANAPIGRAAPDDPAAGPVEYAALADINPRPGSATLVSFNTNGDWQKNAGFRLALDELPVGGTDARPQWDPDARVLHRVPAERAYVCCAAQQLHDAAGPQADGALAMAAGVRRSRGDLRGQPAHLLPERPVDLIAHVLQRAVEGGHWMINPPTLLTLVHAVQQPIGRPAFAALNVEHSDLTGEYYLQPDRIRDRTDPQELRPITAWRRLHETSACLTGRAAYSRRRARPK